jgi:nucleotide-binding universal stress UspA family protein
MACAFKNILVPTDFSPTSRRALEYAGLLAKQFDGSIRLLHVVDDPVSAAAWTEGYALSVGALRDRMVADAELELSRLAWSIADLGITSQVLLGPPALTIVESAAETHADLIVMGTHGRSGISHLLLGSVAERVIRLAPCPVLTVRDVPATEDSTVVVPASIAVPA